MPLVRPTRGRRQRQCDPASESRTLAAGWQTRAGERSIAPERPWARADGVRLRGLVGYGGRAAPAGSTAQDTDRASLASGQNQLSRTIADRDASCKGWESWISGQGRGFGRASWREGREAGSRSGWRPCPTSFLACRWPQLPPRSCRRAQNAGARPLQCGANLSGR